MIAISDTAPEHLTIFVYAAFTEHLYIYVHHKHMYMYLFCILIAGKQGRIIS
jgi:hypothetical protein